MLLCLAELELLRTGHGLYEYEETNPSHTEYNITSQHACLTVEEGEEEVEEIFW